ncbi:hypothetical protein [Streptomyces sp. BRA346]|uniref:hypothetical protein n=1 Tax=Streptomyces sp. BRA346 TaxID=2878199 RepID=UPI004063DCDD
MPEEPIYESAAEEQLARRVAALERLAETRDILDRTEALAARQRQQVEQSRTDLLEKLSRVQDEHTATLTSHTESLAMHGQVLAEHTATLAEHGAMLTEILSILRGKDPSR